MRLYSIPFVLTALLAAGASTGLAGTISYSVTEIGSGISPLFINNSDQIVGLWTVGSGAPSTGFYYLNSPGGSWSEISGATAVTALNNNGVAAGSAGAGNGDIWTNPGSSGPTAITSSNATIGGAVTGLNDAGQMIVASGGAATYYLPSNSGATTTLPAGFRFGGGNLNSSDTVAGRDQGGSLAVWSPATGEQILSNTVMAGEGDTFINNSGEIAGTDAANQPFFYNGTSTVILPTPSNCTGTSGLVEGFNNSGVIVGQWTDGSCNGDLNGGFVYDNGAMYQLSTLVPAGWTQIAITDNTGSQDINDNGDIVAFGENNSGYVGAILLTPNDTAPEPGSWALMLCAAATGLAARQAKRGSPK
jgi:hypothetical protein